MKDDCTLVPGHPLGRRGALQTALVGLGSLATAAGLLPSLAPPRPAAAAPIKVTPNPIGPRIRRSGVAVELVDFCTPLATSAKRPRAALNYLHHAGDGTGWLYACDSRGKLWRIDPRTGRAALFLDLARVRAGAFISGQQMGLRSFAFHPDFARPGRPGHGKLYTAHAEIPAAWRRGVPLFRMRPSVPVHHHNVVAEWRIDPRNRTVVAPSSRREVLRVAQYAPDHCLDQILFDPRPQPGQPGYGLMFIGVGDGGNTPAYPDQYDHAQDLGRALGKILRINPLPGGAVGYRVPPDNPFVGRAGILPEIWALGLRHAQNLSFDRGSGAFLITDIGQAQIEEVNLGAAGANYGWPLREGTFATKRGDQNVLYRLPSDDHWTLPGDATTRPFAYPVAQYDRSEGFDDQGRPICGAYLAITGGFVYRGAAIPALRGHYLCGDLVNGRIFHVPLAELRPGVQSPLRELTLKRGSREVTLRQLVGTPARVDLRFGEGGDGAIYVLTKQDGKIRKLGRA